MSTDNSIGQSNKSKSTQSFQVKKLANLEQRLARWEAQKKENRKEMLTNAFIIFPVSLLCLFVGSHLYDVAFDLNLIGKGVLIASLLMIPLILIQQSKPYNRKPTQADVEADIKLRKSFGMDSSVNN